MVDNKIGHVNKEDDRNTGITVESKIKNIQEWIIRNQRIPTVAQCMEMTGHGYHYTAELRRAAIRDLPRVDMEELIDEVKFQLMERLNKGDFETSDLIKMMPWVAEQKGSKSDIKQEITHKFIVVKPDKSESDE